MISNFGGWGGVVFAVVVASRSAAAAEVAAWHVFEHENVLGTSLELKFAAGDATAARAAESAALAEIERLAGILSGYDERSEFRRWTATQGEPRPVSPELFAVLELFDTWRERTAGAFDASAEVAGRLWTNAAQHGRVPSAGELAAAVDAVRRAHWRLDPSARTATHLTDAPLRLNSLAKSFIAERACAAALAVPGVTAAVVNAGGDLVVRGAATDRIGIVDPAADAENDAPLARIAVRDRAVATSGGYRRGVEIGGRWYSHLIDPRTGRPVEHVRGATVVAPHATDAGALATALCVMDPDEGLRLVATIPEAECLLLLNDGRRMASAGWSRLETAEAPAMAPGVHAAMARTDPAGPAGGGGTGTFELVVNLEVARIEGGRAKRPFVAVWIEDKDGFPVRTLALWFHGVRWLPDLRSWYRGDQLRVMAEGSQIADSVSSATRSAGKYSLKWDGKDGNGRPVPAASYTVLIEAAREHGTHQLMRRELNVAGGSQHIDLGGNTELASVSLDLRRGGGAR
jgi:thiamine biosynthesis lipoprotein ApbE